MTRNSKINFFILALMALTFEWTAPSELRAAFSLKGSTASFTAPSGIDAVAVGLDVGDLDGDGKATVTETLSTNGIRKLFYLNRRPFIRLTRVEVDGIELPNNGPNDSYGNYAYDPKAGWITLRTAYASSKIVKVTYEWSSDMDVIVGNGYDTIQQKDVIYSNLGSKKFGESLFDPLVLTGNMTRRVSAADIDRDGDMDLAFGTDSGAVAAQPKHMVCLNDGTGNFPVIYPISEKQGSDVNTMKWNDYDGDGDMDLGVARLADRPALYRHDLSNGLLPTFWLDNVSGLESLAFGDYDNDGDADLLTVSNSGLRSIELWRQDRSSGPFVVTGSQGSSHVRRFAIDPSNQAYSYVDSYGISDWNNSNSNYLDSVFISPTRTQDADHYFLSAPGTTPVIRKLRKKDYKLEASWTGSGADQIGNNITGLAVDDTHIYICDSTNQRLQKRLKTDFTLVATLTMYGDISSPISAYATNVTLDDTYAYFTLNIGTNPADNTALEKRRKDDLSFVAQWRESIAEPLTTLVGVAVDDQFIYTSDRCRIHKRLKSDLSAVSIFGGVCGTANNQLLNTIHLDTNGTYLYIGDWSTFVYRGLITLKASDGSFVSKINYVLTNHQQYLLSPQETIFDPNPTGQFVPKFTKVWTSYSTLNTVPAKDIQWADMDNDGDLDIVAANHRDTSPTGHANFILRNDGGTTPVFTKIWEQPTKTNTTGMSLGDIDGDGDIDVAFVQDGENPVVRLYLNNGNGTLSSAWDSSLAGAGYDQYVGHQIEMADMDGDGRKELITTARKGGSYGAGTFTGMVMYGQQLGPKIMRITSIVSEGIKKVKIIKTYRTKADGTIGELISTEVK